MFIHQSYDSILIRNAIEEDAFYLTEWWNDGAIMAHAGYPNGLRTSEEQVRQELLTGPDYGIYRLLVIKGQEPIGEMVIRSCDENAVIGIKICKASERGHRYGKIALSLLITTLFEQGHVQRIHLDTSVNNLQAQIVYEQLGFEAVALHKDQFRCEDETMLSTIAYVLRKEMFRSYVS